MGHVSVCHRWDQVAMYILDMSVTTDKGNRYALIIVDCFSRWTEARDPLPYLPNKMAVAVADAFFPIDYMPFQHAGSYTHRLHIIRLVI